MAFGVGWWTSPQTMFIAAPAVRLLRALSLSLSATNLLDRRYRLGEFNYASDFRQDPQAAPTLVPVRHFAAGAPRALLFTLTTNFGGTP